MMVRKFLLIFSVIILTFSAYGIEAKNSIINVVSRDYNYFDLKNYKEGGKIVAHNVQINGDGSATVAALKNGKIIYSVNFKKDATKLTYDCIVVFSIDYSNYNVKNTDIEVISQYCSSQYEVVRYLPAGQSAVRVEPTD